MVATAKLFFLVLLSARLSVPLRGASASSPEMGLALDLGDGEMERLGQGTDLLVAGMVVYAWTKGDASYGARIEHVWIRDGRVVLRRTRAAASGARTWSHHRVVPGHYIVEVRDDSGRSLARRAFTVEEWDGC